MNLHFGAKSGAAVTLVYVPDTVTTRSAFNSRQGKWAFQSKIPCSIVNKRKIAAYDIQSLGK